MNFNELINRQAERQAGELTYPTVSQIWLLSEKVTYPDGDYREIRLGEVIELEPNKYRARLVLLGGPDEDFLENPLSTVPTKPVSLLTQYAAEHDLVFSAEDSPIPGLPLMICCWHPLPMLRVNLVRPVARLTEQQMEKVSRLICSSIEDDPMARSWLRRLRLDRRVRFWEKQIDAMTPYQNAVNHLIYLRERPEDRWWEKIEA